MKLTIAEWSIVMNALNEQLEELDQSLELARSEKEALIEKFYIDNPNASDKELYTSLAYERINQKCNARFNKWIALKGVVDKMEQQEI